jgi:PhoPQ-activated pathogenicity-related protein
MKKIIPLFITVAILVGAPKKTALDHYVAKPDSAYEYKLVKTQKVKGGTVHMIDMTSQRYLTRTEVDRPEWRHWVIIVKPDKVEHETGLLYIGGGNNDGKAPRPRGELMQIAAATGSVVAEIQMVPNQPLVFAGETRQRYEDAIIAYSWDKFLRGGDEKWPLRLPMTKAAVRALDTVTDFMASAKGGGIKVDRFVVTGASKRGWTTWSTAIVDKRVVAIIPIVIDMLNIEPSFKHHKAAYGFYAPAVGDYTAKGVMNWIDTPQNAKLKEIEDPYEYRDRLILPKFCINSAGDQFFLPDSWQFYWKELKGPKHLRYVPNTGHGLRDSDAIDSLVAFYHAILNKMDLPRYQWNVTKDGTIKVKAQDKPQAVRLWQVTNPDARDFRIDQIKSKWTSMEIKADKKGQYTVRPKNPAKGWTAYMIELTFAGKVLPFKFTSGVVVRPDVLPFADKK